MLLPKLLTPEETALAIGVSHQTLCVWRSTGRYCLPFVKSGRLVRYRETDVLAFLESRVRGTAPDAN